MTTNNHTVLALSAALATQNAGRLEKTGVLVALAASHVVLDAIPHGHYYSFAKLRTTWQGAILELGIGLIGIPLFVWYITSSNILWLYFCVFAVSVFDFGVAAGIAPINRLNHAAHWWEKNFPNRTKWIWKIVQTVILLWILCITIMRFQ